MSHHHDKHSKKQIQLKRNKRLQTSLANEEALARGRDLEKEREEEIKAASLEAGRIAERTSAGQPVWSAKLQMIRNKNTGRERMAKERWNRFAGTESGGGRGL